MNMVRIMCGTKQLYLLNSMMVLPIPLPNEQIDVLGEKCVVNSREWIATNVGMHVTINVSRVPQGI